MERIALEEALTTISNFQCSEARLKRRKAARPNRMEGKDKYISRPVCEWENLSQYNRKLCCTSILDQSFQREYVSLFGITITIEAYRSEKGIEPQAPTICFRTTHYDGNKHIRNTGNTKKSDHDL